MTEITKEQVKKIASLARLQLDENEQENLSRDLTSIVNWVEKLQEVDTSAVKPMFAVFEELSMREDVAENKDQREEVLKNACDREYDFYAVPKVIGGE